MTTAADLPLLERRRIEAGVLIPLIRAMQSEFGEERVNEIVREIARSQGEADRERAHIETMADVSRRLQTGVLAEGSLLVDVVEDDEARFGFNVTRCKFQEMYHEMGAADLGYLLSCNRDFALFEGLDFSRTQTRMEGAAHCDFRYAKPALPQ
jgi:hypothetical protein